MAIYFDMDGVLADFRVGVEQLKIPYVPADTTDKAADDAMWDAIRVDAHFYAGLPEIPGGVWLFKALQAAGLAPEILTAVPKPVHNIPNAAGDKIAWNEAHLGPGIRTHICLRAEKINMCRGPQDILFDDLEQNIQEWRKAGGTGVLFRDGAPQDLPPALAQKLGLPDAGGPGPDAAQTKPAPIA